MKPHKNNCRTYVAAVLMLVLIVCGVCVQCSTKLLSPQTVMVRSSEDGRWHMAIIGKRNSVLGEGVDVWAEFYTENGSVVSRHYLGEIDILLDVQDRYSDVSFTESTVRIGPRYRSRKGFLFLDYQGVYGSFENNESSLERP